MTFSYKPTFIAAFSLMLAFSAVAQTNSVSIGTTNTNASAVLWLNGDGKQGLIIPVGNRASVVTPAKGMIIFDTNQVYVYDGANWNPVGAASGGGSVPVLTSAQVLTGNGTTNSAITLTGDASINSGALTVTGIQGKGITLPANTGYLSYDVTQAKWVFQNPSSTLPTAGANQILTSNNTNAPTWANSIAGSQVTPNFGSQALTSGTSTTFGTVGYTWPAAQGTSGTVLTNNGTGALSWAAPSLSGAAGGDLAGTYPNPTVAKLGGQAYAFPTSNLATGVLTNGGTGTLSWAPVSITGITAGGDLVGTYPSPTIAGTSGNNLVTAINNAATTAGITDSKLSTITTAGKVDGGAITSGVIGGSTSINTTGDLITTGTGSLSVAGTTTFGGIKYLWSTPAALTAGTFLTTDATGKLSWAAAGGFSTANYIPRGNGTGMVSSSIQDDGSTLGIGVAPSASTKLYVSTNTQAYGLYSGALMSGTQTNYGLFGEAQMSTAQNVGVRGEGQGSANPVGVMGNANNATSVATAVQGIIAFGGNASPSNIGVEGNTSITSATSTNYGLKGSSTGTSAKNFGVYGTASSATTNWAGYFDQGNVHIKGGLSVGATDGTYGTAGQVLTSNGSGLAPSWTTVATGSSFSTINTIPKGDGTTLVASNLFDNGSQVSATISNASSYAFGISNGGGAGVSGRQGLNIGATASGTENVFGIALTSNTTSSGYNDAIYAIATGSTGRTRGLAAGAYSGTVTNIGVDSYASGSGSSTDFGIYNHVSGGATNYGVYNNVSGGTTINYGVYNSVSGAGSYGIYSTGETYNYFSGSVGIGVATPAATFDLNGSVVIRSVRTTNVSQTITPVDYIVIVNSASVTLTLPSSPVTGRMLIIINAISTGGTVAISPSYISGTTSQSTINAGINCQLVYDGTNWRKIN